MSKFTNFLKDTRGEMKRVTWPTRKQTINYTLIVIAISVVVAALLGLFDFLLSTGLSKLLAL
jgi:preprotein translocase subunit SecE